MVRAARELAARGVTVATFDFPYMAAGRSTPDKAPVLESAWRAALGAARARAEFAALPIFIGGKSMGGRIASQVAAREELVVRGLVFLGYPLHPPKQPQKLRSAHLPHVGVPMLFVQGTRDEFGGPDELAPILRECTPAPRLYAVDGADHSFKVGKRAPDPLPAILDEIVRWMDATRSGA